MGNNPFSLGAFSNPDSFKEYLDLTNFKHDDLLVFLQKMLVIRFVENKMAYGRKEGFIGGPVHLAVGQEAIAVGLSHFLNDKDYVFGGHRSHAHILALGADTQKLFAEVLGRETGFSQGRGGSMHLIDQSVGFYGSVPIVAGTVPLAVGSAIASRLQGSQKVSIAYLGDGACEEGVFHESLNLARINNEPIIFVVENNLFSSHMHISQRQPLSSTARFAYANDIDYKILDGNDVISVAETASSFIKLARNGKGPFFIEAVTYRWLGHVDWREDIDVGVQRSKDDISSWRAKDPIKRLKSSMIKEKLFTEADFNHLTNEIKQSIDNSWSNALKDSYPSQSSLLEDVYTNK